MRAYNRKASRSKILQKLAKLASKDKYQSAIRSHMSNSRALNNNKTDMKFNNLYVFGDGFYSFHENGQVSSFEKWLHSYRKPFCDANLKGMASLSNLASFNELVDALHDNTIAFDDRDSIMDSFRRWYAETYQVFRFDKEDSYYVTSCKNNLLKVLYDIDEKDIITFDDSSDSSSLAPIPQCQNNWFIDCCDDGSPLKRVFSIILEKGVLPNAHFKFISKDGDLPLDIQEMCTKHGISNMASFAFTRVTTIPNIPIVNERYHRYDSFAAFGKSAETVFFDLLKKTTKAQKFHDYYLLNVWSNGNVYNKDITLLNIGWGCRPYALWRSKGGFKHSIEDGSKICITRNDDGFLTIMLYPAHTENRRQREDSIVFKLNINPDVLSKKRFQKKLWRILVAYMEVTSLDGDANLCQRLSIMWLKFVKHTIRENIFMPRKIIVCLSKIFEFSLTVGLSGFILKLLEVFN